MTRLDTAVVIAVQEASRAKSRLGADLDSASRRALVIAMLDDVLTAVRRAHAGTVIVVSADEAYDAVARAHDAEVIRDAGVGYNPAVAIALDAIAARGIAAALVLPGDLPQLRDKDITLMLDALAEDGVVVVPSADGGTIALGLRPLHVIRTAFGPESAQRHREGAQAVGVPLTNLVIEALTVDVDTLADLALVRDVAGSATARLIEQLDALRSPLP